MTRTSGNHLVLDLVWDGQLYRGCRVQGSGGLLPRLGGLRRLLLQVAREPDRLVRVYTSYTARGDTYVDVRGGALQMDPAAAAGGITRA